MSATLPEWLHGAYRRLCAPIDSAKVAHALMLNGSTGIGKRQLAKQFAQRLLCTRATALEFACGQCAECLLVAAGTHPDEYTIGILEDKQSISIEQIRQLSGLLHQSAHRSGYRVVTIAPAESMTLGAANALLKTLEEPGQKTVLILIADDISKVSATIRSRCVRMPLSVPETEVGRAWLQTELASESQETIEALLQMSSGAPLLAKVRFEQGALEQVRQLESGLQGIAKGLLSPGAVSGTQPDIELSLDTLQRVILGGVQKSLQNQSPVPARVWDAFAEIVLSAKRSLRRNASLNSALLLESVLAQWFDLTAFLRHSKS